MKDYYALLGLGRNAPIEEIRKRFLELARLKHPDRFADEEKPAAESRFQEITEAFNVLSNPERRRQHDYELNRPSGGAEVGGSGAGGASSSRVYSARGIEAYRQGDIAKAAEHFEAATDAEPRNARLWYNLALSCERLPERRARGLAAIKRACELDGVNPDYLLLLGRLFLASSMFSEAARALREAANWGAKEATLQPLLKNLI